MHHSCNVSALSRFKSRLEDGKRGRSRFLGSCLRSGLQMEDNQGTERCSAAAERRRQANLFLGAASRPSICGGWTSRPRGWTRCSSRRPVWTAAPMFLQAQHQRTPIRGGGSRGGTRAGPAGTPPTRRTPTTSRPQERRAMTTLMTVREHHRPMGSTGNAVVSSRAQMTRPAPRRRLPLSGSGRGASGAPAPTPTRP